MFRSISNKLIIFYLLPFKITSRLFYYVTDIVVSYRGDDGMAEFDALYENINL